VSLLQRPVTALETVSVDVPETALEAYEAALSSTCTAVAFFRDHRTAAWRVEGVKSVGSNEPALVAALALAAEPSGVEGSSPAVSDPCGGLACSILRLISRTTDWPTILRTRHARPQYAIGRPSCPDAGCRPRLRVRRPRFDAWVRSHP